MGHSLPSSSDTASTPAPAWRAACAACGWSTSTTTYSAAGDAARAHGDICPEASTVVDALGVQR